MDIRTGRSASWEVCLPLATILWACSPAITINSLSPRPEIGLPHQVRSLCLVLDPSIAEQHHVDSDDGVPEVVIEGWRRALEEAFVHGFGRSFDLGGANTDLCLRLSWVRLTFTAEAGVRTAVAMVETMDGELPIILAHGSHGAPGSVRPRRSPRHARVDYAAELLDRQGTLLRRVTGSSVARQPIDGSTESITHAIESAIQSLYETLSVELFEHDPVASSRTATGNHGLPHNERNRFHDATYPELSCTVRRPALWL
jgi:hypothetical protein